MRKVRNFPAPMVEHWDWQLLARCRGLDPAVFFIPRQARGEERSAREAAAKAHCASCAVMTECLEYAIDVGEPAGIWGGLSPAERGVVR